MIVDCHTHIWADAQQLGNGAAAYIKRQSGQSDLPAGPADHSIAARCVDKSLVLGYRCANMDAQVDNDFLADYVGRSDGKVIAVAGVDPTEDRAVEQACDLLDRPEFRALTISPADQNFHPADSRAMAMYELAQDRNAPIFFNGGTHFRSAGHMEYARPFLLDEVAREFPDLTIVISSLGHPWIDEGISLIGKHPRVFADLSGLIRRPWQAYNALVLAHQFNVIDKLLFGSDFPFSTAAEAIESLYRLHEVTKGTNLPSVPREELRSVIERDALTALGITRPGETRGQAEKEVLHEEDVSEE